MVALFVVMIHALFIKFLMLGLQLEKSSAKCAFNVSTCEGAVNQEVTSSDFSDFQSLRQSKCSTLQLSSYGTTVDHNRKLPPNGRSIFHRTYSKQSNFRNKYRVFQFGNNADIYIIEYGVVQMIPSRAYSVFDLHNNVYCSYEGIHGTREKQCDYHCDGRGLYYHSSDYLMNFLVPWAQAFSHIVATVLPLLDFACPYLKEHPHVDLLVATPLQFDLMAERCPSLPFRENSSTTQRKVVFLHELGRKTCVMARYLLFPFFWNSRGVPLELGMCAPGSLSQQLPVYNSQGSNSSPITKKSTPRDIIYLARPREGTRHLLDEKAIMTRICKLISPRSGLKLRIYRPQDNYNYDRKVFENARAVISAHSGAMANMIFAPPDTIIFEIVHPIQENAFHIGLAHSLSLQHVVIPATNYSHDDHTVKIQLSSRKVAINAVRNHLPELSKYRVNNADARDFEHVESCIIMVNRTFGLD